jgi:hypothetical protein
MKTRFQHGGHGVQTRRATEETEKRESEKEDGREDFNTEGTESGHGGPRRNSKAGDRKARRKEEAFGTEKADTVSTRSRKQTHPSNFGHLTI